MIHPERGLAAGSGAWAGIGALGTAEATLAAAAGGGGSDFAAGGSGAGIAGAGGATAGGSFFAVITVVIVACGESGGEGRSCRLSDGKGVKAAVRMLPG